MLSAFSMIFHLTLNIIWCQVMAPGLIAGKLISQKLKLIKWQKDTDKELVEFSKIR